MNLKFKIVLLAVILALVCPLHSKAYNTWLVKGRVGFLNVNTSLPPEHSDSAYLRNGYAGEISLTKLFTPFIGMELGTSLSNTKTKEPYNGSTKNINVIPISGFIQLRAPIKQMFVPYFGVGGMYRVVTNLPTQFKFRNGTGIVYQAGVDLFIAENIGANFDVKWARLTHRATDAVSKNTDMFKMKVATTSAALGIVVAF